MWTMWQFNLYNVRGLKKHDVNDLAIFNEKKLEVLKLDIQEFESSIYPMYQESLSNIPNRKAEMIKNSQALKANLNEQGRRLHREIDKCIKEMQTEIDDMDAQNNNRKTHKIYQQHNR